MGIELARGAREIQPGIPVYIDTVAPLNGDLHRLGMLKRARAERRISGWIPQDDQPLDEQVTSILREVQLIES